MGRNGGPARVGHVGLLYVHILMFCRNYDEAIRVMQRASAIPKNTKINYHDHVRAARRSDLVVY